MADFNVSITMSNEPAPTDLSAGSVNNFIISNPNEGSSYFVLETVKNSNGAYDSNSPKNLEGTFSFTSGISNLVTSSYQAGVVVSPEGGTLTFTPTNAISKETLRFRGTGAGTELTSSLPAFMGLIDEYPGATAAYSLRKLSTEYTGSIIDIRRDSDDTVNSFSFTSEGILDTASIENFVNHANELPGDSGTSSPVVSYSLRKVVAAYTGSAINVRRSSDDANLDIGFDANGDLDTTALENFVNGDVTKFTSDFANITDLSGINGTPLKNQSVAGVDGAYKFTLTNGNGSHIAEKSNQFDYGLSYTVSFDYYIPSGQTITGLVAPIQLQNTGSTLFNVTGSWESESVDIVVREENVGNVNDRKLRFYAHDGVNLTVDADGDVFYLKNIVITQTTADGHVETWYDQSPGTQNNATQTDDAKQPLIVDAGSVILENSKPAIDFDGVNDTLLSSVSFTQPYTAFAVRKFVDQNDQMLISHDTSEGEFEGVEFRFVGITRLSNGTYLNHSVSPTNTQGLLYALGNGSNSEISIDGGTTTTGNSGIVGVSELSIGGRASYYFNGKIQEAIYFDSDQSSNRLGIEANINSYYNIYTPNTTGSVAKWYDQSGNDNHATQTNETKQPLIVHTGSVILENGKLAIDFDGVNDLFETVSNWSTGDSTTFHVVTVNDTTAYQTLLGSYYNTINTLEKQVIYDGLGWRESTNSVSLGQNLLGYTYFNSGSNIKFFNNGSPNGSDTLVGTQQIDNVIGSYNDNGVYAFVGKYQELIHYNSDQSLNHPEIEVNINNAYNIFATSPAAISSPPTISGVAQSGLTLTATSSSITGVPFPVTTFRWENSSTGTDGWSTITGQTSLTYTVQDSDLGKYLRIVQIATNGVGSPAESPSTSTDVVRTVSGAFVLRVETDGGEVENESAGDTQVQYLLNNP